MKANARYIDRLKYKMAVAQKLSLAKQSHTYYKLSSITGLPVTMLTRYVKGNVLPSLKRASALDRSLSKIMNLKDEIRKRIRVDKNGYLDNTSLISNITLLNLVAQYAVKRFVGKRITKVLTAAVDGVPLATMVGGEVNVDVLVAKRNREVGVDEFIEETYVPSNSAVMMSLYLPKNLIVPGDDILIVDDVIRSGETQRALINLVRKRRAYVTGIFSLIAVGERWKEKLEGFSDIPVVVVLPLPE
ncbi:MAG: phosphoribosyltransferase family protein [Candidatus Bathyarchaeia archaeon]